MVITQTPQGKQRPQSAKSLGRRNPLARTWPRCPESRGFKDFMTITQRSCKEYLGSYRDYVGLSGYYPSNAESNEKMKQETVNWDHTGVSRVSHVAERLRKQASRCKI